MEDFLEVWGMKLSRSVLSTDEITYLSSLPISIPSIQWVWKEIDRVWDSLDLNNKLSLESQAIAQFYAHPVWIMNGIFSALDPISFSHRQSIAKYVVESGHLRVTDFGGGFGELAKQILQLKSSMKVIIVEPYPSLLCKSRIQDEKNIQLFEKIVKDSQDVVIAQDVLEHVEDPILLAYILSDAIPVGGIVIFANCFHPYIKCHLPATFHLRFTFRFIMIFMGLSYIGCVPGANHAQIFRKTRTLSFIKARFLENISKLVGPLINLIKKQGNNQ